MERKIGGVEGVLDEFISGGKQPAGENRKVSLSEETELEKDVGVDRRPASQPPRTARKGRPPGRPRARTLKKKTSVWIGAELMDDYREWSWDERCTLGELIERALTNYRRRRGRAGDRGDGSAR